jgi:hypothetical protein
VENDFTDADAEVEPVGMPLAVGAPLVEGDCVPNALDDGDRVAPDAV